MARARVGGLARKTGINPVPIVIFVVVAALAGGGLFAWDYLWRQRQEEATRPPAPDVLVRSLVEGIIGKDTVKEVKVDAAAGEVTVTFESATFKPGEAVPVSRERLAAEAELASSIVLNAPPPIAAQVPVMQGLKKVSLTLVYQGAPLATAVAERGKNFQITYIDPRLEP